MHFPEVNYLAVLVSGVAIFVLGGLWYSPVLFAKKWVALQGRTEEEMRGASAGPIMFVYAFLCGLLVAWTLAVILKHFSDLTPLRGVLVAILCWLGFARRRSCRTSSHLRTGGASR